MINYKDYLQWDKIENDIKDTNSIKKQIIDRYIRIYQKRWPNLNLNIDKPVTIQDKENWLKTYDITPAKSFCADKILVHEYTKDILGKDICIPIIGIYDNADDINYNILPNQFVIKCNHGYKMNIIVQDKSKINTLDIKHKLNVWLKKDFGKETAQYHYSAIKPKIFIEQYMTNGHTGLTDYKFMCFNGEPLMIQVINDRYNGDDIHANIYDLNWKPMDLGWSTFKTNYNLVDDKPINLQLMIEYAKQLSKEFILVRIDFYEINGKLYLGEMTFTPDNGYFIYKDKDTDILYGQKLKLPYEI